MPYLGEITMFACSFNPLGWYTANGQLLPIVTNTQLFGLYGTTFGGNGRTTFQLPNLGGQSPMHPGQGSGLTERVLGEVGGEVHVSLDNTQLAIHQHNPAAVPSASVASPSGSVWSNPGNERPVPNFFSSQMVNPQALNTGLLGKVGGNLPHNNLMPYVAVTICVCMNGEVPVRP